MLASTAWRPAYADPDPSPDPEGRVFTSTGVRPTAADYAGLRAGWRAMLIGKDVDPADERFAAAIAALDTEAAGYRALLDRRADRDRVFTDQPFDPPSGISQTYVRTARIATAWATQGSALYQNADVLAELLAALRTTYDLVYNESRAEYGNWWEWEIGSPRNLTDTLILVYDHVAPEDLAKYLGTIDHFVPDPFYMFPLERRIVSTGANRVDLCRAVAVRGILGETDERIGRSRDGLSDIFAYVTSGDGFYRDGSFVQHGTVAYTGTYGIELIDGMSKLIALLAGSAWEVDDPNREVLFRAIEITFAPVIYDNQMLDFVRGRAISRTTRRDHHDGHSAVEHILKLAEGVAVEDADRAARWRGTCKGWLTRDTYDNPFTGARVPRVSAYAGVLDDKVVPAAPEPSGFTIFPSMDRVIHRRPGWAYGISMSSKRISSYECGNGENNTGFHGGEGMTYLYLSSDNGQWADSTWPTTDYYRMPGTTIDTKPLPPQAGGTFGAARPQVVTWVGGASLDGELGAVGQDLEGILAPLSGRKSWFCLDDYVVALGAGITDTNGFAAVTTVENRNLHAAGENRLLLDGIPQPAAQGWSVAGRGVRWAHLSGVAGYVFPGKEKLSAVREERTGSWRDINTGGPTAPITRRWLTLWIDHGVDPVDAGYAYVVAPNASARRTRELAQSDEVKILANTKQAQAIWVPRLGVVAVNFWQAGRIGDIVVDAPCSLVLRERHRRLTVAVAEPTQLQGDVNVALTRHGYRAAPGSDPTIEVTSVRPAIRFVVHAAGTYGVTQTARFQR
jgi:hyaluronate lyase